MQCGESLLDELEARYGIYDNGGVGICSPESYMGISSMSLYSKGPSLSMNADGICQGDDGLASDAENTDEIVMGTGGFSNEGGFKDSGTIWLLPFLDDGGLFLVEELWLLPCLKNAGLMMI